MHISFPFFKTISLNYKLSSAAKELFFNLQEARAEAIKKNKTISVVFNVKKNQYEILNKTINLKDFYVFFGYGKANVSITNSKNFPNDYVSYSNNTASFTSYGTAKNLGYVYLSNHIGSTYAIGTNSINGNIVLRKWNNSAGIWE